MKSVCLLIGLVSVACVAAAVLWTVEAAPPIVVAGILLWSTRTKWYAAAPGFVVGCLAGCYGITSSQPEVVVGGALEVGALGTIINVMCCGFVLHGLGGLIGLVVFGWLASCLSWR